jgi:hypothetical protein
MVLPMHFALREHNRREKLAVKTKTPNLWSFHSAGVHYCKSPISCYVCEDAAG